MTIGILLTGLLLFILAYFSKRRFGLLGLGLIAGVIVSSSWSTYVTSMLQVQGVHLNFPPLSILVAGFLIVLPALLLLLVGPTYHKKWQRLVGSILFAFFSIIFITSMIYQEAPALVGGEDFAVLAASTQATSIILVVALAFGDVVLSHLPKRKEHNK